MPCGGDAFESLATEYGEVDLLGNPVLQWGRTSKSWGCPGCAKHESNGGKCGYIEEGE